MAPSAWRTTSGPPVSSFRVTETATNTATPTAGEQSGGVDDLLLQRVVLPDKDEPFELLGIYVRSTQQNGGGIEPPDPTTLRGGPRTPPPLALFFHPLPARHHPPGAPPRA